MDDVTDDSATDGPDGERATGGEGSAGADAEEESQEQTGLGDFA
jgi:hypothetical protein